MNRRIVIQGLGRRGTNIISRYNEGEFKDKYTIVAATDKNVVTDENLSSLLVKEKIQLISREKVRKYDFDYLIITNKQEKENVYNYYCEIEKISSEKIIYYDEFVNNYIYFKFKLEDIKQLYGVEIGGPTQLFMPIYSICQGCDDIDFSTDTVWKKKNENLYKINNCIVGKVIICDATDLKCIPQNAYDFLLSSNNLEHIANPIKSLLEWKRIVKNNGLIYIVVPRKEKTFDHNRKYTSFEHIVADYQQNVQEDDLSHLEEILEKHDLSMDVPMTRAFFEERSRNNYQNRCLHQHVYSKQLLEQMLSYCKIDIVSMGDIQDCYYIIGRI